MLTHGDQIALTPLRISNGASAVKDLPARLKLLDWGSNAAVTGSPVIVNEITARELPAAQARTGFDRIALDYEHNTVPGSEEHSRTKEPREVAAYGVPRVIPGQGLFLEEIEWTPSGRANALNFADLSPTVHQDKSGVVKFIHSSALTRAGAVVGLSFFNVTLQPKPQTSNDPASPMAEKLISLTMFAALLGMAKPEEATEDTLKAHLKTFSAAPPAVDLAPINQRLDELSEKIAKLPSAAPVDADQLTALSATVAELKTKIDGAQTAEVEKERTTILTALSAEGKVPLNGEGKAYSADALKTLDLSTLRILRANTPATVPISQRGGKPSAEKSELKGLAKAIAEHEAGR